MALPTPSLKRNFFLALVFFLVLSFILPGPVSASESPGGLPDLSGSSLTGVPRLACEAILCLSSSVGGGIGECQPSLSHYFGINLDYWSDTVNARRNFLNQCPNASAPGMASLVNAIVDGAGFCDAATINKNNRIDVFRTYNANKRVWSAWSAYSRYNDSVNYDTCPADVSRMSPTIREERRTRDNICIQRQIVINNAIDRRCINLVNHAWTDFNRLVYDGDMYSGGRWIERP